MILNFQGLENDYPTTISSINDVALDNVKVFKYLGSNIKYNEENTGDSELEFRIDTAQAKLYELGKMFNYRIYLPTRIKLLNALVRSRLVYSCQTWSVTQTQLSHVNAYLGMIRKCFVVDIEESLILTGTFFLTRNCCVYVTPMTCVSFSPDSNEASQLISSDRQMIAC